MKIGVIRGGFQKVYGNEYFFSSFLLFFSFSLHAQELKTGNNSYFKASLYNMSEQSQEISKSLMSSVSSVNDKAEINIGDKIKVLDVKNDTVYFKYLLFKDSAQAEIYNKTSDKEMIVYEMSFDDSPLLKTNPFT